jgi:hypothetical protein
MIVLAAIYPIFAPVPVFIGSAVLHLCMLMTGAARREFMVTYRVLCFTAGAIVWLAVVPFIGGAIAGIWNLVISIVGLARAHNSSVGRVLFAYLLPNLLCALLCGLAFLMVGAAIFSVFQGAVQQSR